MCHLSDSNFRIFTHIGNRYEQGAKLVLRSPFSEAMSCARGCLHRLGCFSAAPLRTPVRRHHRRRCRVLRALHSPAVCGTVPPPPVAPSAVSRVPVIPRIQPERRRFPLLSRGRRRLAGSITRTRAAAANRLLQFRNHEKSKSLSLPIRSLLTMCKSMPILDSNTGTKQLRCFALPLELIGMFYTRDNFSQLNPHQQSHN